MALIKENIYGIKQNGKHSICSICNDSINLNYPIIVLATKFQQLIV